MRKWFTSAELAGLDGMPKTERGVRKFAEREGWEGQRRLASKAIEYPFGWLPPETQAALLARLVGQEEPQPEPMQEQKTCERDVLSASRFSDSQRSVMQARLSFVREIERMSKAVTQQRAIMTLVGLPLELWCVKPRSKDSTEREFILPAGSGGPRPDYAPWGLAQVGEMWVETALQQTGQSVELAAVPGAIAYRLCWMPRFVVHTNGVVSDFDEQSGLYDWSLEAEEL
ncbi:DNA-binding protein [Ectopseudomonas mendocina]|uniref:DNA-binding protein n=1 Tax=Ectopseudomonas mendocina TaxID=300 RepID=UPI003F0C0D1B